MHLSKLLFFSFLLIISTNLIADNKKIIEEGMTQLMQDNDTLALKLFYKGYELAKKENDIEGEANALLKLGIASYGSNMHNGLKYALDAIKTFEKIKKNKPKIAEIGYYKCIQLIATIKSREGKNSEALKLCFEIKTGLKKYDNQSEYLGLVYSLLGSIYQKTNKLDSAYYYYQLSLHEREKSKDTLYLSSSYTKIGMIELMKSNKIKSKLYFDKGLAIAEMTNNKQSIVMSLISLCKWNILFETNNFKAKQIITQAKQISSTLSDKTFYLNSLIQEKELYKLNGNYEQAFLLNEYIIKFKDSLKNTDYDLLTKKLEIQFDILSKDRKILLAEKEVQISKLITYLLLGILSVLSIGTFLIISFYKKLNKKDKELLRKKEELKIASEKEQLLIEKNLQNEIEYKESQLTALTIQMLQKKELLISLKEKIELLGIDKQQNILKIINKDLIQENEWNDFLTSFESINKNFYNRIKQQFSDISPNELKICALIKMNLSIKEMANILNISPDSVKTARYRLRKKLQLSTEDNLTEFILNIK